MSSTIPKNAFRDEIQAKKVLEEIKKIGKGKVISVRKIKKSEPPLYCIL
jgi:hypothetical protein